MEVVKLEKICDEIAILSLQDKTNKNTFTKDMILQLKNIFDKLKDDPSLKCLILTGYENYFCCGASFEELSDIVTGKHSFNQINFYRFMLDLPVPTIPAVQGHALGGGLAFACYADIILFSEESLYSANFMKYGITPGLGSTYIIPYKVGQLLGYEMLLTAKGYTGRELRQRGCPAQVLKRENVLESAIELAYGFSDKPLFSLKAFKKHMTKTIVDTLPGIINQELKLHKAVFSSVDILSRVEKLYPKTR